MVSIMKRMRTLRAKLFNVRCGPGAIVIPRQVTGLVLNLDGTATGLKNFWRKVLPRIRYHNEELPIQIREGGAFLMVQYGGRKPNHKIHCRNVHESGTILKKLVEETKAEELKMTATDKALAKDTQSVFGTLNRRIGRRVLRRQIKNQSFVKKHGYPTNMAAEMKAKRELEEKMGQDLLTTVVKKK